MVQFLKKTLSFCGVFIFLILTTSLLTIEINRKLYGDVTLKNDITTLIIGDSHTELAINDSLIPGADNISSPAEGYIFTYLKLESILKNNHQIKNIILGVSYHNFSAYYDKYISGEEPYKLISQNISLLDYKDLFMLIKRNPSTQNLLAILRNSVKEIIKFKKNKYPFMGGFHVIETPLTLSKQRITKRIKEQYYLDNQQLEFSNMNISYLQKIVELCRRKKIRLTLLNTPLFEDYYLQIPPKIKDEYNKIIKSTSVSELNLNDLKLDEDCFLPDGDHLNYKGAMLTTRYLLKYLKENHILNKKMALEN